MTSFVFQSTLNGLLDRTLDLAAAGTFNAHIVTAKPAANVTTVAGLTLASGGSLNATASVPVTGKQITGNTFTFTANPVFNTLWAAAATPFVGTVFSRQVGGSPATTDPVLAYLEIVTNPAPTVPSCTTTAGSETVTTTGTFPTGLEGRDITGTGIPADTVVVRRVSATEVRLSKAATASGTVTLTVNTPAPFTPPTVVGGALTTYTISIPTSGVIQLVSA